MLPNPVAGNFEIVVPGHFGSAVRSESHMASSALLTSVALSLESSELSSFIDALKSRHSTMSRDSTKAVDVVLIGRLDFPTAQPKANGNWPSGADVLVLVRRAVTFTTLYGVAFH